MPCLKGKYNNKLLQYVSHIWRGDKESIRLYYLNDSCLLSWRQDIRIDAYFMQV